jgi:probable F420-dependent oxidoreductase
VKIGFGVPVSGAWATPAVASELSTKAERLGYSSLWTFQRLISPVDEAGAPLLAPQYRQVQDPLVLLAYIAALTTRVRLGVAVVNAPYYSPALLAKMATTLDQVSGGRLDLGIGLGWMPEEFQAAGADFEDRGRRTDDFLGCLYAIWNKGTVSYQGEYYRVPPSLVEPKPVQQPRPPVLLGGTADAALRRAGRLADGWVSGSKAKLSDLARSIEVVKEAASRAGRDPERLRFVCRGAVKVRSAERGQLTGQVDDIRYDIDQIATTGMDELFVDLNFDPEIASPDADVAASVDKAHFILEELSPR